MLVILYYYIKVLIIFFNIVGSKTWAHVMGLGTTFPQQYVWGEEIIGKSRNWQ